MGIVEMMGEVETEVARVEEAMVVEARELAVREAVVMEGGETEGAVREAVVRVAEMVISGRGAEASGMVEAERGGWHRRRACRGRGRWRRWRRQ